MTSIILVVIGILLAALTAFMTIYYGGDAFESGAARASAVTMVNHMQQYGNAIALYEGETGMRIVDRAQLPVLTPRYIKGLPQHPFWEDAIPDVAVDGKMRILYVVMRAPAHDACLSLNRSMTSRREIPVITDWHTQLNGRYGCYDTGAPHHLLVMWGRE